jgi:hypothetical protein
MLSKTTYKAANFHYCKKERGIMPKRYFDEKNLKKLKTQQYVHNS